MTSPPTREDHPPAAGRIDRRRFLAATGISALALGTGGSAARAATGTGDSFRYEVTRSEEEWRARLDAAEYKILRDGDTELPFTSPLWEETRAGRYACKGCDLPVYNASWKAPLDKGWVFFAHGEPDALLMGIDGPQRAYGMGENFPNLIEVHCRRCGSHMGHILKVDGEVLHCINGTALSFAPSEA